MNLQNCQKKKSKNLNKVYKERKSEAKTSCFSLFVQGKTGAKKNGIGRDNRPTHDIYNPITETLTGTEFASTVLTHASKAEMKCMSQTALF